MLDLALNFWVDVFTEEFQENTTDELKMKVVKMAPFQDDPIRKAPYFLIGVGEKGLYPEELGEIGGSAWWIADLRIKAAPKSCKTPERAYYLVNLLTYRLVWLIRQHALEGAVGAQGTFKMENRDWHLIRRVYPKVYGGEKEWLSYVEVDFINRFSELGPFPYGIYPGDIE